MTGTEHLTRAETAFAAKSYVEAIEQARAALAAGLDVGDRDSERGEYVSRPETSSCELLLGVALHESGQSDAAIDHLNRAVDLDRDEMRPLANRGHVRRERGELDLALADLTKALQRDGSYAFALFRRAQCLLDLGRSDDAERDLGKILSTNPFDAAPRALWEEIRARRGAPTDLSSMPVPGDFFGLFRRGLACVHNGEAALGIVDYDAALAINPQPPVLASRGVAHHLLGHLEAAKADFEAFLQSAPTNEAIKAALDRVVAQIEERDRTSAG